MLAAALVTAALVMTPVRAQQTAARTVRVAAASDLRFALDDLAARLARRTPPITLLPTYASSGTLHAQLRRQAPFDVYLSADVSYPEDLVRRGIGNRGDLFTYARGHIVVWVPSSSKLPVERDGLAALRQSARTAIANPEFAPYGRAAEAALRKAGLWDALKGRLVLGENVAQTAQFVQSGSAAAGIISKSLALAPAMRAAGRFVAVPPDLYPPVIQAGLILPWAASRETAVALRDALLGPEGRQVLSEHGLDLP